MADGTIRIGTKLDTSGIKADIKELKRELENVRKEQAKADAAADKARASYDKEKEFDAQFPEEFSHREEIDEKFAKEIDPIIEKQEALNAKEKEYSELLGKAEAKLQQQNALAQASKELDSAAKTELFASKITTQEQYNSLLEETKAKMDAIERAAERVAQANGVNKDELLATNPAYQKLSDTLGILTSRTFEFKSASDEAKVALAQANQELNQAMADNKFAESITSQEQYNALLEETRAKMAQIEEEAERIAQANGVSKDELLASNPAYQKLSHQMGVLTGRTFEFEEATEQAGKTAKASMRKAKTETNGFGKAITGAIKKVGRMALAVFGIRSAYNAVRRVVTEYLSTNELLAGQLETLKSGFAYVLGPAIELIINLLFQAVSAVNSFVYALSGINFMAKANEAALNKQAKATGAASKATNQLAGFDEQTKLSDTSGGGSSDPVRLLDTTGEAMSGFAERLKNMILEGDWYGAGAVVGEALMDGIARIEWKTLGSKIGEILSGAVSFALGFALNIDPLELLASTVELLTGFLDGVTKTIQTMDWEQVGKDIMEFLVKGFIAATIVSNPFATLIALIFTPQGQEITSAAAELAGSILGALARAIIGAGKKASELASTLWNSIKDYFDEYVDWKGTPGEIINGLFRGIADAIKGIGKWIYNNIWVPFRDGFKSAFGIASPSKKMREFGGDIISGLINGIKAGIKTVVKTCKELLSSIKSVFSSVGGWFKDKFKSAGSNIASAFKSSLSKIKTACTAIWSAIKSVFSNVTSWFRDKFKAAWTAVKNVFSTGGKIFTGIKDGIASTFKTIVNGLISGINRIISTPFNSINKMLNTIRSVSVLGAEPFKGLWSYNPLSIPQIPKLALGGIVNRPGRGIPAIIGEAGAEAVLPLENNTEWMDVLADKINTGTITIPIYIDGKKMYTYIVDIGKRKAFAANGG